jgi:hypothetical protein
MGVNIVGGGVERCGERKGIEMFGSATNIMFANPRLEESFRYTIKATDKEIGGWFIVDSTPQGWPGKFSWKKFTKAEGKNRQFTLFINHFIVMPNESLNPKREFNVWDVSKTKAIAVETAKMYSRDALVMGGVVHFHSHPNNNPFPSPNDIAFAGFFCSEYPGSADFCIAIPDPMRLCMYGVDYRSTKSADNGELVRGTYFSWRENRIRELVK